jgi:Cu-processing system permease protein
VITATATPAPASTGSVERFTAVRNVMTIARKEIRDSLRNRWFILYTVAFGTLAVALSLVSLAGTGMHGFAGFGRTAASLINLVILIVPLMALTVGASAIAGERERGTLSYLLAQPVTRMEVLAGKYLGLASALLASLALGFGLSSALIAWRSGTADASAFVRLVGLSLALALAMLSVGFLLSVLTRKGSVAAGAAVFLWLGLVFLGDLGLMGSTVMFKLQVTELFQLALLNPLQVFKMAALDSINASLDVLGPAGLYASQAFCRGLEFIFIGVLGAWIIAPLAIAAALFCRRGEP